MSSERQFAAGGFYIRGFFAARHSPPPPLARRLRFTSQARRALPQTGYAESRFDCHILGNVVQSSRDAIYIARHVVSWGTAGVDPDVMGIGPAPATRIALERAGLHLADLDLIEVNEAFAAQCLAVAKELDMDRERLNVNGGAIALGRPLGATGTRTTLTAMYELRRRNGRFGLSTMCIGGGQGIAAIVENLQH